MLSTSLKDLAVELDLFISTSYTNSGRGDENTAKVK